MSKAKESEINITDIEPVMEEQPKTIPVPVVLEESIMMLNQNMPNLLAYDDEALENFGIVIATVRRNIKACIIALRNAEKEHAEEEKNGQNNPE